VTKALQQQIYQPVSTAAILIAFDELRRPACKSVKEETQLETCLFSMKVAKREFSPRS